MKRRNFLKTSASTLLAAPVLSTASFAAAAPGARAADRFFYDERFPAAREFASRSGGVSPTPVRSDVTELWTGELNAQSRQTPLTLRGVTTESFYFCLTTLLQSQASVEAQIQRVDKDLYAWTIDTRISDHKG